MGDLIAMTHSTGTSRRAAPASGSAEILFFTGVRYYRMAEEVLPQPPRPKRRRSDKAKRAAARPLPLHG